MADSNKKHFDINNLVGGEIPQEIADQLKVLGRVKFSLKDTTLSAVSTSGEDYVHPDEKQARNEQENILAHVGEMEDLVEQMEDMIDDLTKDMNIPVTPGSALADAVQNLGGTDNINRDVFDTALAIVDNAPALYTGPDPFLAGLGNGKLDGPFMNCSDITRAAADAWNSANPDLSNPNAPVVDASTKLAEDFEESKSNMIIEMIQMLFWNILWAKYLVDLGIINPLRMMIAYPLDGIIMFFKKACGKRRFKAKSKDCLKKSGPINKKLNKFRCFLLCVPPKKLWDIKRYKPMVQDFNCKCEGMGEECPPKSSSDKDIDKDGDISEMGAAMDQIIDENDDCISTSEFLENADRTNADKFGAPPQCLSSAKLVLDAVVADAMSPKNPDDAGIGGTQSISSILQEQIDNIGGA